ncbi:MAG: DUF4293 domain-containing protein [Candidatus Kapabacteria bacterium]|nr:DUF4293 domain-containing protein [Candidatus Kapabacteria bacterium]
MLQYYKLILISQQYFFKNKIYFCRIKKTNMLQRIQTLYLMGAFIATGVLSFIFPLWKDYDDISFMFLSDLPIAVLFIFGSVLSILAIMNYKKRQQQSVIIIFNIILNVILSGLLFFHSIILSGENNISEKGIGLILPIISIVFLLLAHRAIKKDEKLVKSSNRIR